MLFRVRSTKIIIWMVRSSSQEIKLIVRKSIVWLLTLAKIYIPHISGIVIVFLLIVQI